MIYEIPNYVPHFKYLCPQHFLVVPFSGHAIAHVLASEFTIEVKQRAIRRADGKKLLPAVYCEKHHPLRCYALQIAMSNAIAQLFPFPFKPRNQFCKGCSRLKLRAPVRPLAIVKMRSLGEDRSVCEAVFPATRDGFCRALWGMPYEQLKRTALLSALATIGG